MAKHTREDVDHDDNDPDDVADRDTPTVGLYVVRAREAEVAVIFRRGPTKQVRMVRWDMWRDEFQRGQWLAGRVYPERSDISPNGIYVLYFAIRRGNTWNAISKVPYFSPLAVWEELTWRGGGTWRSNTEVRLSGNPANLTLDPKFTLPPWLTVGWDRDAWNRDGWQPIGDGPYRLRKPHPTIQDLELQRRDARGVEPGRLTDRHAYVYRLFDHRDEAEHDLGTADWGDWHPSGDIALAREGLISRTPIWKRAPGEPAVIADFNAETFEKMPPPADALIW